MSHILDPKIAVLGQQFFQHGKASFYGSDVGWDFWSMWCTAGEISWLSIFIISEMSLFHILFLIYWLMLQVSSPKSSSWIACTTFLMVYFRKASTTAWAMMLLLGAHFEVGSHASNWREAFQGFPLEYSSIACQTKCSHQQQEKFVCHEQHFVFALIHFCLIAVLFVNN